MTAAVAIRLGTTGKGEVKNDFAEIGEAGDASARRWSRAYERAGADAEAAIERQARAAAKLAMITPQTSMQQIYQAGASTNYGGQSARESANAFRELLLVQEQLEARARALRAAIDPAWAAQQRFDAEMGNAKELIAAGVITLDEYCAKLRVEKGVLDQAQQAHGRVTASAGQVRAGMQQLSYNIGDVTQQFALGTPVMVIFAQQGGQIIQALGLMQKEASGFVGFMAGPWGAVILGAVMILGVLSTKMFDAGDASDDLAKRQSALAGELDRTTGKVKEQVTWLTILAGARDAEKKAQRAGEDYQSARQALRVGGGNAGQLFVPDETGGRWVDSVSAGGRAIIDQQLARYNGGYGGGINAETLVKNLQAAAKNDPSMREAVKTIEQLAFRVNEASEKSRDLQVTLARTAVAAGTATDAQKRLVSATTEGLTNDKAMIEAKAKLAGATTAMDRAQAQYTLSIRQADDAFDRSKKTDADKAKLLEARTAAEHALNVAQDANRKTGDKHAQSLARQADAMVVNADAALTLARAYLTGSDAALKAEAARKGLTDATRKGIDGDSEAARQLQIMVGDRLVEGARALDQLRDQTIARKAANDDVAAGALAAGAMNERLSDEAVLRPLLKLQTVAQGDALNLLTDIIGKYRAALGEAHAEEARGNALAATANARQRVADIRASILDLGKDPLAQAVNAARRSATVEADQGNYTGQDRADFINARVEQARAEYAGQRAQNYMRAKQDQEDSLSLSRLELALLGANDNYREAELAKLQLSLRLKREGLKESDADYKAIMAGAVALDAVNRKLAEQKANWDEIRSIGSNTIDTILNPDDWKNWGDFGRKVLHEIELDLLRLAAINPLKNALFGSNLPTLTGVLGSLFGGKSATKGLGSLGSSLGSLAPGNASGTDYWSGGMMLAGERGPELVEAPRGARVFTAADTRRIMAANDAAPQRIAISVTLSEDLDGRIDERAANVAVEVHRLGAPQVIEAAKIETVNELSRRRM